MNSEEKKHRGQEQPTRLRWTVEYDSMAEKGHIDRVSEAILYRGIG